MIKKLHHVAVAVESVQEALRFYYDVLGLTDITIKTMKGRGLKVALIRAGDTEIELLEPTNPDNTVRRFLERRGSGLHHICFQVDDIEAAMRELEGRGGEFIEPVPREGAVGLVSFMPPSVADGVLVEFAQIPSPHAPAATAESAPTDVISTDIASGYAATSSSGSASSSETAPTSGGDQQPASSIGGAAPTHAPAESTGVHSSADSAGASTLPASSTSTSSAITPPSTTSPSS